MIFSSWGSSPHAPDRPARSHLELVAVAKTGWAGSRSSCAVIGPGLRARTRIDCCRARCQLIVWRLLQPARAGVACDRYCGSWQGRRMGADRNKLLLPRRPACDRLTLQAALAAERIAGLVWWPGDGPQRFLPWWRVPPNRCIGSRGAATTGAILRAGGLPADATQVLIHDGARCLAEPALFDRCADALAGGQALIAATPVTDTIKRVDGQGVITATPDRSELWAAQTPQGFQVDQLRQGHAEAQAKGWSVTDDAVRASRLAGAGVGCRPGQHQGHDALRPHGGGSCPGAQDTRLSSPRSPSRQARSPRGARRCRRRDSRAGPSQWAGPGLPCVPAAHRQTEAGGHRSGCRSPRIARNRCRRGIAGRRRGASGRIRSMRYGASPTSSRIRIALAGRHRGNRAGGSPR